MNPFVTSLSVYSVKIAPVAMDQCGEASAATKLSALTLQDRSLLTAKVPNLFETIRNILENHIG